MSLSANVTLGGAGRGTADLWKSGEFWATSPDGGGVFLHCPSWHWLERCRSAGKLWFTVQAHFSTSLHTLPELDTRNQIPGHVELQVKAKIETEEGSMRIASLRQQLQFLNIGACSRTMSMVLLLLICILQQILPSVAQTSIDEHALNNFRAFVTSDPNNAFGSWDQNVDVCQWDHVTCNENQRVISLDLSNQDLVGTISASLGALEFLEHLNLENNSFTGVMPLTLGYLVHLQTLKLGDNNLNGALPRSVQMTRQTHARSTSGRSLLSTSDQSKKNNLPLILGVVGGVTSFILLSIFIVLFWRWYRKTHDDKKSAVKPNSAVLVPATRKKLSKLSERARKNTKSFTVQQLETATENFSHKNVIGEGGFGLVYRGTLPTGQEVAIKHAHEDAQQGLEEFYNEVELLSKVHHKYLVDLIGYCDEGGEQLLVYEFIPNGNLFEHLCGQRTPPLTWKQRVDIAVCCAKALAHLHEGCTPSIIHRDIKPSNILLDNDLVAKVADFGLSKTGPVGDKSHVSTGVKGTPGYLDPYYYLNWHLGAYSDVYGFGVILLQLVASKPAVDQKRRNRTSSYSLIAWAKDCLRQGHFDSIVDPKLRLQGYNRDILMLMVKLGIRCTGEAIKERPSMKAIYEELEHALETLGSLPSVKGSPASSFESVHGSRELTPESVPTMGDGQDDQFNLYSKIYFDGRSWIDIKNLGEDHSEEQGQDHSEEQGQDHSEEQGLHHSKEQGQDYSEEQGQDHPEEQGREHPEEQGREHPEEQGREHPDGQGRNHSEGQGQNTVPFTEIQSPPVQGVLGHIS